uniref:DNA-directed RNA polymerase I subunit, putative n=1 Tax=Arundo donax TaxID=35708 RepID=A0A0A9CV28_ARUDO
MKYSMWKSYGLVNHKALHQVYELDTGNPMTLEVTF